MTTPYVFGTTQITRIGQSHNYSIFSVRVEVATEGMSQEEAYRQAKMAAELLLPEGVRIFYGYRDVPWGRGK